MKEAEFRTSCAVVDGGSGWRRTSRPTPVQLPAEDKRRVAASMGRPLLLRAPLTQSLVPDKPGAHHANVRTQLSKGL